MTILVFVTAIELAPFLFTSGRMCLRFFSSITMNMSLSSAFEVGYRRSFDAAVYHVQNPFKVFLV